MRRPYFTAQLESSDCRYEVRVNDVPVEQGEGCVTCEIPLNQWVFTGDNILELIVRPEDAEAKSFEEAKARCKITIYQRESGSQRETRQEITGLSFGFGAGETGFEDSPKFSEPGAVTVISKEPALRHARRKVPLKTPFPRWTCLSVPEIPANDPMRDSLILEYRRFWSLLNARDVRGADEAMKVNAKEMRAAYYMDSLEASLDDLDVRDFLADPEIALELFDTKDLKLQVFGYGRMARLAGSDGKSPIIFLMGPMKIHLDLIYCQTKRGWVMVR